MADNKKIVKYRKNFELNIGTLLFGILFIYMIICIAMYLTSSHIAPYEVVKGNLSGNYKCTALALKSEMIVEAPESGSVTYYAKEGTQIGANGAVCSVNEGTARTETSASDGSESETVVKEGGTLETDGTSGAAFSSSDARKLRAVMSASSMRFSGEDFQQAYEMKADVEGAILDIRSGNEEYGNGTMTDSGLMNVCRTPQEGIVVYSVDGFEQVQPEDITTEMFDTKSYSRESLRLNASVAAGEPLYKLITGEEWFLMVPIDNKLATELTDQSVIKIRFLKDGTTEDARVTVFSNGDAYFAQLKLDYSVIRFANDRFLEIELLLNKKSGLKIPKSAIAEKMFYVIPEDYVIYNDENAHEISLVKESYDNNGTARTKSIMATVYEKVDDQFYVDINLFSEGDYVIMKDTVNKYRIEETATLQGVYNINKGYAVFREITVLADNEEYCIVEEGTTFGLSQYDHIALNAETVTDDQILY